MRATQRLVVWLRSWFGSAHLDADSQEELRFHLEREIQANRDAGMSVAEAKRAAHLSLGNAQALEEELRAARPGAWARQIARDVAYGARLLRRAPAFAMTGAMIIALGVGATTAIFSVLYGVVLRPLPFPEPNRLVSVWMLAPQMAVARIQVTAADYETWRVSNDVFSEMGLFRPIVNFNLTGDGDPERLFGVRASASLFRVLGVAPALGRVFTDEANEIGRDHVAVLSDGLWRRRFGADRSIVGRTIMLSGVPHTIVAVMKPEFKYPNRDIQIWTPLAINPAEMSSRLGNDYVAVARLRPGASLSQAQGQMDVIARRVAAQFPVPNTPLTGVEVLPLVEQTVGGVRRTLYILSGAVICLLLIACLNLASLFGARAASRGREFALRLALGASRTRLALQALAEVAPIVGLGGLLGVGAAALGVAAFVPFAPATLPRVEGIAVNWPVLLFSCGMLVVTGLLAGLLPAAQAWRSDLVSITREQSRSSSGGARQSRTRRLLVVAQIALVLPLLVGAGLLTRSFATLVQVDPGFRSANVLSLQMAIPRSKYETDAAVAAFSGRILARVAAVPGVVAAGMVNRLPLGGVGQVNPLVFENVESVKRVATDTRTITPDYFRTMGIPLIEGRPFAERDGEASLPVGIIDERVAHALWPGQSALGHRFRVPLAPSPSREFPWFEIVGVVGHVRHDGLDVDPRPQVYYNYLQRAQDRMALVVRGSQDVRALTPLVLQAIREVDRDQPVYDVRPMDEVIERSTSQRWLSMALVFGFAAIALLLASVGLYGVIAYGVTLQIREFGVRLALGAERADILRLVLRRGAFMAIVGSAIGLVAATVLSRAMETMLFGVTPNDAVSFAGATAALMLVALLASYLPARRAASVDPAIALRAE